MNKVSIEKLKEKIKPTDKIIMAKKDILPFKFPVKQEDGTGFKPSGLWYAIGTAWIDWTLSEMPHWMGKYFYKIITDDSNILILKTPEEILQFTKEYKRNPIYWDQLPNNLKKGWYSDIGWKDVSENYSGIEINPYQQVLRFKLHWYYGWDIASGCIWEKNGIKKAYRIKYD